jgi:hypothetical protein
LPTCGALFVNGYARRLRVGVRRTNDARAEGSARASV